MNTTQKTPILRRPKTHTYDGNRTASFYDVIFEGRRIASVSRMLPGDKWLVQWQAFLNGIHDRSFATLDEVKDFLPELVKW